MRFVVAFAFGEATLLLGQAVPDPYGPLLTYGPLGIFTALLLTSRLVTKAELDRANARADHAEAQRDELAARMISDIVPLVAEVQRTMAPALNQVSEGQGEVLSALARLQSLMERIIEWRERTG